MVSAALVGLFLQYYGHEAVSVVDGGLTAWEEDGGEITQEVPEVTVILIFCKK